VLLVLSSSQYAGAVDTAWGRPRQAPALTRRLRAHVTGTLWVQQPLEPVRWPDPGPGALATPAWLWLSTAAAAVCCL